MVCAYIFMLAGMVRIITGGYLVDVLTRRYADACIMILGADIAVAKQADRAVKQVRVN